MLERCSYSDIQIAGYGFPLTENSRRVSNWLVKNERAHEGFLWSSGARKAATEGQA
jgi:hypothetical protein